MKKILFLLAALLLCGFRAPNGDIITEGDPEDKLLLDMGQPLTKTTQTAVNQFGIQYVTGQIWVYKLDKITYRFKVENGVITAIEWSR
jgi:hypothetical protein